MLLYEVTCGSFGIKFSNEIPRIISLIIDTIKIAVPILLIIFCMLDLGKIVISSKEEEIKKNRNMLFKRAITAILIFFVISLTETVVSVVGGKDKETIKSCMNCMINNECMVVKDNKDENNSTK